MLAVPSAEAAFSLNNVETKDLNGDFVIDNKEFHGNWKDARSWDGSLCDGYYQYAVQVRGRNESIDFQVKDENTMNVTADLRDIYAGAQGVYRSSYSACVPVGGWLGVTVDSVLVNGYAILGEESLQDIKIKITSTQFGTIHMGKWVPRWFEDFATDLTNRALKRVWASHLGDWLSGKLTDLLKKKLPHLQP